MSNISAPLLPKSKADIGVQARSFVEDSWFWVQEHWLNIAIATGVAIGVFFLLHLIRAWAMRLCQRGNGVATWRAVFGRALAKTGNFFILMASIKLVAGYANTPPLLDATVDFLFTISAVFQAAIWVRELIFGAIEHRTSAAGDTQVGLTSAMGIIRLLVSIALFAIAIVMVLGNLGVNVTGLVAGLGIGGIAIGLAAQGIFGDLIAALSIIFDRPFRVGETIKYDNTVGTIEAIGLKSTRLRAADGELRIISNRQLLDKEIQNFADRPLIRIHLILGIAYETPPDVLDRVPAMLREIAEANGGKAVRAGFNAFGASTLDYEYIVEFPTGDWDVVHPARDHILTDILRRFASEKINLPYPAQITFTAAPDGTLIMPYPEVQPVLRVDKDARES